MAYYVNMPGGAREGDTGGVLIKAARKEAEKEIGTAIVPVPLTYWYRQNSTGNMTQQYKLYKRFKQALRNASTLSGPHRDGLMHFRDAGNQTS
jgi:recombinational DNA repair ATPase RecF